MEDDMNTIRSSSVDDEDTTQDAAKEDELVESAKAEMAVVRDENARLKNMLEQIQKEYKSLQRQINNIFQQESMKIDQEHDLVSLRLGTSSTTESGKDGDRLVTSPGSDSRKVSARENGELKLGLDCNLDQGKDEDGAGEKWPPSKVLKTQRSGGDGGFSDTSVKRARVCVRARCDTPTMNDGCQWRKYGQKIAKNNPCPRAYYRCTVSQSCPVRKQVQRCVEDMSILITTYEGNHNHPLPLTATAMASTTSAAATMLLSGASTSLPLTTTATNHHEHNFHISTNSIAQPLLLPYSSSTPFPTVTLDLTANPMTVSNGLNPSSFRTTPRIPTTLSFSSMESNMTSSAWGSGGVSYGASLPYNNYYSLQQAKLLGEQNYQTSSENFNQSSSQQALTETLTKVITSDPSFRSVIAAAISSMAANGGTTKVNSEKVETSGQNLKWDEHKRATDSSSLTSNGNDEASNYLNKSTSLNSQS